VVQSVETTTSVPDPVFSYPDPDNPGARINTRKTTSRNTPSVVNAVFNSATSGMAALKTFAMEATRSAPATKARTS